ncbi:hypothetical protein [Trueperella pyogenes]|uniref:hypothetical protein n=1 Tax=Trueperella pyogenes TaxID=1661 RepID=UPI00345C996E
MTTNTDHVVTEEEYFILLAALDDHRSTLEDRICLALQTADSDRLRAELEAKRELTNGLYERLIAASTVRFSGERGR